MEKAVVAEQPEVKVVAKEGETPAWMKRFEEDHPDKVEVKPAAKKAEAEIADPEEKPAETIEEKPAEQPQTPAEDKPAEEQPVEEEVKPDEAPAENKDEAYVKEYADRRKLSLEEAKEEVQKNRSIVAKYKSPEELAEAYRNSQSEYHKLKTSVETTQTAALAQRVKVNPKAYVEAEIRKQGPEKLITDYRAEYPAMSRDLDDEQVLEKVKELAIGHVNKQVEEFEGKVRTEASARRDSMLASLKETDKAFYADIKPVLAKIPDAQIVAPDFNFNDLVDWARGKQATRLIKEAEDRGYQRGLKASQQPKIVAQVSKTPQAVKSAVVKQSTGGNLSAWQKDQARTMFASGNMSDEERFEAYYETVVNRKNKK